MNFPSDTIDPPQADIDDAFAHFQQRSTFEEHIDNNNDKAVEEEVRADARASRTRPGAFPFVRPPINALAAPQGYINKSHFAVYEPDLENEAQELGEQEFSDAASAVILQWLQSLNRFKASRLGWRIAPVILRALKPHEIQKLSSFAARFRIVVDAHGQLNDKPGKNYHYVVQRGGLGESWRYIDSLSSPSQILERFGWYDPDTPSSFSYSVVSPASTPHSERLDFEEQLGLLDEQIEVNKTISQDVSSGADKELGELLAAVAEKLLFSTRALRYLDDDNSEWSYSTFYTESVIHSRVHSERNNFSSVASSRSRRSSFVSSRSVSIRSRSYSGSGLSSVRSISPDPVFPTAGRRRGRQRKPESDMSHSSTESESENSWDSSEDSHREEASRSRRNHGNGKSNAGGPDPQVLLNLLLASGGSDLLKSLSEAQGGQNDELGYPRNEQRSSKKSKRTHRAEDVQKLKDVDTSKTYDAPEFSSQGTYQDKHAGHGKSAGHAASSKIDWKDYVRQYFHQDLDVSDDTLLNYLKVSSQNKKVPRKPRGPKASYRILYRVRCAEVRKDVLYEDQPYYVDPSSTSDDHIRGRKPLTNLELYLDRNHDMSFIVYKTFYCCRHNQEPKGKDHPNPDNELIQMRSEDLCAGLKALSEKSNNSDLYPNFSMEEDLEGPYLWYFHEREAIASNLQDLAENHRYHFEQLQMYIDKDLGEEYSSVDSLLKAGQIAGKWLHYLFIPGELHLVKSKTGTAYDRVWRQIDWPTVQKTWMTPNTKSKSGIDTRDLDFEHVINFFANNWDYDGSFAKGKRAQELSWEGKVDDVLPIQDLDIYPLKFNPSLKRTILERGKVFWTCRNRRYISYRGWDYDRSEQFHNVRFMIDTNTYRKMHTKSFGKRFKDELGEAAMAKEEPDDELALLLPPDIFGFNMLEKKWVHLLVENFFEVEWNTRAFDTLVVNQKTKELIEALITKRVSPKRSTDLIGGKGNGLIMLLHGGPGTGKTLTAESVAEFVKKPLYRVTCGDIGTKPEDAEKYLSVVLYLGRRWDCVVLLDEAEVFLQERNLEDLQRNALVSVFLRVLEYYDGILILTSNRVGTLDEAFKSRVQLALHYEKLGKKERRRIWETFVERLSNLGEEEPDKDDNSTETHEMQVDTSDLRANLDRLAEFDMNGRQIRNVLTTARQLAMFRKAPLNFRILKDVIQTSIEFETYLTHQIREGKTDDEIARDEGIR